ncbi:hypothetical protein [uncultured Ruminococcus sp.]|uniref:hypothetical protein n=1 Tax=uncultured Ruminococcus sp. TaxID=165186 RepID=UPI002615ACAF|nr:hypothetical protein [uncultured Ruminococcus sp.]
MKKFISAFIACSLALLTFASCGSKSKDDKKDGKTADIEGKWALSDVPDSEINSAGLIFGNNGSGSMYEETSSIFSFSGDSMNLYGYAIDKEYIKEENDVVTVTLRDSNIIVMKRLESSGNGFDGKYSLSGGSLYDSLSQAVASKDGKTDITVELSDGHSFVIFNDLFTYKTKGKDLVISGCSPLIMPSADENSDEISAEYKVEGDKLTIIDDKNTNVLTKVA